MAYPDLSKPLPPLPDHPNSLITNHAGAIARFPEKHPELTGFPVKAARATTGLKIRTDISPSHLTSEQGTEYLPCGCPHAHLTMLELITEEHMATHTPFAVPKDWEEQVEGTFPMFTPAPSPNPKTFITRTKFIEKLDDDSDAEHLLSGSEHKTRRYAAKRTKLKQLGTHGIGKLNKLSKALVAKMERGGKGSCKS